MVFIFREGMLVLPPALLHKIGHYVAAGYLFGMRAKEQNSLPNTGLVVTDSPVAHTVLLAAHKFVKPLVDILVSVAKQL
jgi:hypothetical protein